MAVIVTKTENPGAYKPKRFPKLMAIKNGIENSGTVVFFEKEDCGTIICGRGYWALKEGGYDSNWAMCCFEDYNEPITIQNA